MSSIASGIAVAGIYKWVDEDGKVHYSEKRPSGQPAKRMRVPTKAPKNTSTYKRPSFKSKEDKDSEENANTNNRQDKAQQKADKGMSAEEKAKQCTRARQVMETLTAGDRVRQKDEEGNITYMTEEEKQERIKHEQKKINRYCK
jgi:hypothetical protein